LQHHRGTLPASHANAGHQALFSAKIIKPEKLNTSRMMQNMHRARLVNAPGMD